MNSLPAQRIVIVDILRGFALFGVLVVHLSFSFSGWGYNKEADLLLPFSTFDKPISEFIKFFFTNKFRGIFSFLFGLSFSILLVSSMSKGLPYQRIFYRRMAALLVFGVIHAYVFWSGDVLRWYVIGGLVLFYFRNLKSQTLLIAGLFLTICVPFINGSLHRLIGDIAIDFVNDSSIYNKFAYGSYSEVLQLNLLWDLEKNLNLFYRGNYILVVIGQFMIGLWVGRNQIFKHYYLHRKTFKKVFYISLVTGLIGTAIEPLEKFINAHSIFYIPYSIKYPMELAASIGVMGLATSYICGITLLHDKPFWKNKLAIFIPVGKMALTNYIMQSVLGILIFYGIGLGYWGHFSLVAVLAICLLLFSFQIIFSKLWLNYFLSGPLEWILRMMIDGKTRPIVKAREKKKQLAA